MSAYYRWSHSLAAVAMYLALCVGIQTIGSRFNVWTLVAPLPLVGWILWNRRNVVTRLVYCSGALRIWTLAGPHSSDPIVVKAAHYELASIFRERWNRTVIDGHPRLILQLTPPLGTQLKY